MTLTVKGPRIPGAETIFTPGALVFLERLVRTFDERHRALLDQRKADRAAIRRGELKLDFDPRTRAEREGQWQIAPLVDEFWEPGIELTGPASDANMVFKALTSGAVRWMADAEDACSPTWANIINTQLNLIDAVRERVVYTKGDTRKELSGKLAKLMFRPRGLHLPEPHVTLDGHAIPAALLDEGLYLYHNAHELRMQGKAVHLYLPKRETALEARYDNDRLQFTEQELAIGWYDVKITYLNENIRATFGSHEILWETRLRSAGFNVGRYDEMASMERMQFRSLFPERRQVTMAVPKMDAYVDYVGQACYQHGTPFYGGMEAQIPVKDNPEFSAAALAKAEAGKRREAYEKGCVRAWVAHPGMVQSMQAIFQNRPDGWQDEAKKRYADLVMVSAEQLNEVPQGTITESGIDEEIDAYIRYVAGWLTGTGAVAIDYHTRAEDGSEKLLALLMEDAATAEQARTHLTKCVLLKATLDDGRAIDKPYLYDRIRTRLQTIERRFGNKALQEGRYLEASDLLVRLLDSTEEDFPEYLTEHALPKLLELEK